MTSIACAVYERDAATLITKLPQQLGRDLLVELNGDGGGSFQLALTDALLTTYPALLAGDNVVKMRVTNAPTMDPVGWIVEEAVPVRVTRDGGGRVWNVKGRGMRARPLSGGVIYPEGGIRATSGDNRAFDFSSADGPWLISADWGTPLGVRWDLETTHRANKPVDWPDTNAYWIWSTDPEVAGAQGRNWFRSTITLASAANVGFFVAADNVFSLRVNGEEVLASDFIDPYAWQKMFRVDMTMSAGTHQIAAWVHNTGASNPAGFLATITTLDADAIPDTLLRRTNTTDWTVHTYAPPTPGWPAAQILSTLVTESVARAEMGGAPLTIGYTDTLDTDGNAWDDVQEISLPIGASILDVLPQLTDAGLDVEVAHDFTVNAWKKRGTDLSTALTLRPGRDIEEFTPEIRYGTVFNSALMRHGTGWVLVEDSASITANGRRAVAVTTGGTDSATQATQTATQFFTENSTAQVTLRFTISSASPGPKPFKDFNLGDILSVPTVDGTFVAARCMSIGASEPASGLVVYDVVFYPEP